MVESVYPMIPVEQAQEIVLAQAEVLAPVRVPLAGALGLVLAEAVTAREPLPPFAASIKDGYAVVAADGPGVYPVIGEATAGKMATFRVSPGTVAYVTTGAPLPPGADAVVMVEETREIDGQDGQRLVEIRRGVPPGHEVRAIGVDVASGQEVLAAGEHIGPVEIGLLATVGAAQVKAHPRPRVAVLSTGDELVDPVADGAALGEGQIRDSNRHMLLAAATLAGAEVVDLGIAPDDGEDIAARIERGLAEADVLLTSGGVSMGDLDLIKPLLERTGTMHFGRLRMKPGKPCTFATVEGADKRRLVFGLPGNPVSSMVTFYLMAVPALRKLAGWPEPRLRRVQAHLSEPLPLDPERPEYHRATLRWEQTLNDGRGGFAATSTGSQASSRLLSLRTANALLELPASEGRLKAGAVVDALLIGEL